jgi:hypothetical protein
MTDGIEIDFLPVGEGEHSGDAIAVRWRDNDQYKVMIYDGGTRDHGAAIVDHVKKYFDTTHVDYVVNSHPDNDHAGGLVYVLENLTVGELWMHRPWEYSAQILQYFHDGRITDESLAWRLKQKMTAAFSLEKAAQKQGIPIFEPFAGSQIGIFTVLSPTDDRYVHELIPQFEKSPELKKEATAMDSIVEATKAAISYIACIRRLRKKHRCRLTSASYLRANSASRGAPQCFHGDIEHVSWQTLGRRERGAQPNCIRVGFEKGASPS